MLITLPSSVPVYSLLVSFAIVFFSTPGFISFLKKVQTTGQPIREYGPRSHDKKQGTPCLGGLLIIAATVISTLIFANFSNNHIKILIFTLVAFGGIGFTDDYQKLKYQSSKGMTAKRKFGLQSFFSTLVLVFLSQNTENICDIIIPHFNLVIHLGIVYTIFAIIVITGSSNAVNLTDGLDGLAAGNVILVTLFFLVFSCFFIDLNHFKSSNHIENAKDISIFCGALVGSLLGFLYYNVPKARIFMGDTGSLSLGAVLGVIAIILKIELLLPIIGLVFVLEALSVILQVLSYKLTGKRIFKMSPLHHHFEKSGWDESTIVIRSWILTTLLIFISFLLI